MNIEQVQGIIESLTNHYEKHKEDHSYSAQSRSILERRSSAISISSSAAKISAIYEALRKNNDNDALKAFRDTMVKFSQEGSGQDFIHFVHTAEDLAKTSPNILLSIFSTVSDFEEISLKQNLSIDAVAWLSNIGYLTNDEIEAYVGATEQILQYDPEYLGASFERFVKTTGELVKTESPDQKKIDSYFEGVVQQKDDISFSKFDREFRSNNK